MKAHTQDLSTVFAYVAADDDDLSQAGPRQFGGGLRDQLIVAAKNDRRFWLSGRVVPRT
jgi:hypothetical protein